MGCDLCNREYGGEVQMRGGIEEGTKIYHPQTTGLFVCYIFEDGSKWLLSQAWGFKIIEI